MHDVTTYQPVHYIYCSHQITKAFLINSHISLSYYDTHCKHPTLTFHLMHAQDNAIMKLTRRTLTSNNPTNVAPKGSSLV